MPRVVHFEIHAGDPQRAITFYQQLFGWSFTKFEGGPMPYWVIKTGDSGPGIDGGMHPRRGNGNTDVDEVIAYVCTVNVEDLDQYIDRATKAGASVCVPKMPIPGVGWLAYCKDTEGNIFGMLQPDENVT
jgi:hypothetical protein